MKKIAIITMYFNSINYGGNLQAYALAKFINSISNSFNAMQISYQTSPERFKIKKILHNLYYLTLKHPTIKKKIKCRLKAIQEFNRTYIPHTEAIYNNHNIELIQDKFELFITGSDQVWNPEWIDDNYILNFINNKPKMSYAASIGVDSLNKEQLKMFKYSLKNYYAISVREERAAILLNPISPVDVEWVLDPTMLLCSKQWDELCSKRLITGSYLFCYMLGDNQSQRELVTLFAKKNNIKIAIIPHIHGSFKKSDKNFGDYQLYEVSPKEFISLIKYADYIFTDSFHATVYSLIYKKEFFSFERHREVTMSSRLYSLMQMFDLNERFLDSDDRNTLNYIESLKKINYDKTFPKYDAIKRSSIEFLETNIMKAIEGIEVQ